MPASSTTGEGPKDLEGVMQGCGPQHLGERASRQVLECLDAVWPVEG
jgi:hypothetical protein